jgi:hypothetical protein
MAEAEQLPSPAARVLAALTPHPHRGDLIAAGVAPLVLGVLLVNLRLDAVWGTGAFLVLDALACALVLGMGWLAPLEGERPRSYQQVLLLAGLLLLLITLMRLAQVLGVAHPLSPAGSRLWILGAVTGVAAWLAHTRRSAVSALVAALLGIVAALAFVQWAFAPKGFGTLRWVLLAIAIGLVLGALSQRERRPRESVYLVDAAGVATALIGLTFAGAIVRLLTFIGFAGGAPGGGWKVVLLAAGLGLVAYAGVDHEPGPAYAGAVNLLLFVLLDGIPGTAGASLWFWPLALLLVGILMVAAGLRPRRPLPPEPGAGGTDAPPPEPLPGPGAGRSSRPLWSSPGGGGDASG